MFLLQPCCYKVMSAFKVTVILALWQRFFLFNVANITANNWIYYICFHNLIYQHYYLTVFIYYQRHYLIQTLPFITLYMVNKKGTSFTDIPFVVRSFFIPLQSQNHQFCNRKCHRILINLKNKANMKQNDLQKLHLTASFNNLITATS